MTANNSLLIDFHGFWHAGSGRSAGALVDALVQKNANGLPVVGGRHIKGLLRHAVAKTEKLGWFSDLDLPEGPAKNIETLLFGSANQEEERFATLPGMLIVNDAGLPQAEAAWLAAPEQAELLQYLYGQVSSTAITELGSAQEHSLRAIEVSLPAQLTADLQLVVTAVDEAHRAQQKAWLSTLAPWLPLIEASSLVDGVGSSRSRGLGEVSMSWQHSTGDTQ
ncbi:hypothetical protein CBP31_13110 [Oceanisphaera profunda]|uniref:CRISPR type III-associated protein domain-containing protein n=1 Tax=Oceanisphaera profunda TaxID=1416627 RepID=A0A1Y0D8K2_9GAMM|nr:RAMP superfamily CRISPR-associated protein [Oceanisphaera profunda]ART83446.1 hypothetical protein CBP31_13110 [Oceanisphaera profunda]